MILTRKLIAPAIFLFIVLLVGLFVYFFWSLHDAYHEAEEGDLASFSDSFSAEVENQKQIALSLAAETAGSPAIQEAFGKRDRQMLRELALPSYDLLRNSNDNIVLYQFHLADGRLFFNANDPAASESAETMSSPAVLSANLEQKPIAGLESENGKLGIRGVVPVYYQGEHIGSVEFGIGFNETLLIGLKEKYGGEWQILLSTDIVPGEDLGKASPNTDLMLFATTQDSSLFNDPSAYVRALDGESTITHPSVNGRNYAILSAPIYDYSGRVIGVLDIIYDHTHISAAQNTRLLVAGSASLGALILGILALVLITRRTLQPIQNLTRAAADIAEGNMLSYVAPGAGDDEIGILINAFNRMTMQLRSSIVDLEQRVAERTENLENQALHLRAAAEITRDAASARYLGELLERSTQLILERFNFYHVGIFILDKNQEYAVLAASPTEAGKKMIADNFRLRLGGMGIVEQVAATGESRTTLDVELDGRQFSTPFLPNTRSELALPLTVESTIIGVLDIQSEQPQAFHNEDEAILQVMADQLATAIERTRLLEELELNLHELEHAHGQYTREAWQRFRSSGRIANLGYRSDNIHIQPINELTTLGQEALMTGAVARSNGDDGTIAIAIPIKLRGQTIGVVNTKLKEGFANTLTTLESAIERLASALESARLYEEASLRADREQSISQVTAAISSSAHYEEILRTTVTEIGTMLKDAEVAIQIIGDSDEQETGG